MYPSFRRPARWSWRHWCWFAVPQLVTLLVAIALGILWAALALIW